MGHRGWGEKVSAWLDHLKRNYQSVEQFRDYHGDNWHFIARPYLNEIASMEAAVEKDPDQTYAQYRGVEIDE